MARFLLRRPVSDRYPEGVKVVEVTTNGEIEMVSQQSVEPGQPFLFELLAEEQAERLRVLQTLLEGEGYANTA